MKKAATLSIVVMLIGFAIMNSCSKSSDSTTPATNNNPSNNGTSYTAGLDSDIVDGVGHSFLAVFCNLSTGTDNIYTIHCPDDAGGSIQTTVWVRFWGTPTTKVYPIAIKQPNDATTIQLYITTGANQLYQYTALTGNANVTIDANQRVAVTYKDIVFQKTSTDTKKISVNLQCP